MIKRYKQEFEEMYERIIGDRESPFQVISEYLPNFEDEGIGAIGISHYLGEYISQRE